MALRPPAPLILVGALGCGGGVDTGAVEHIDDLGGVACLLGSEPVDSTVGDTVLAAGGPAWALVLADGCAPNDCQVVDELGCTAVFADGVVTVDATYAYTRLDEVCTTACGELWLTCAIAGGLPAGTHTLVYEDAPAAAVVVPHDGPAPCVGG
jgi:hypothetical protein